MTLHCPACQSVDVVLDEDNGAEYPETRVEWYECNQCGNYWRKVLTA